MRILSLIARLNVGGAARHVLLLTRELNDGHFRSELIAGTVPDGEEDMAYFADELGVKPIYIREMSRKLSSKDIVSLVKIYREIKRRKPNIVDTHTAKAGTVGRLAAFIYKWFTPGTLIGRPRRVKVVHTFHGHVFHSYYGAYKTRFFIFIERLLARFATDVIVVISKQQLDEINGRFLVGKREQFRVITYGIDLKSLEPEISAIVEIRQQVGAEMSDIVVGFVGRLTEIKNVPMLLQVANQYLGHDVAHLPVTKFLIAGDGHLRVSLEDETHGFGLSKEIRFVGNVTNIASVYKASDIIALTSLNEGTPFSLIEAMAAGRPVISTMVGGVVDLLGDVKEQKDGFLVCERGIGVVSGDVAGFTSGLIYLAKNERLRHCLAEAGHEFVVRNYSIARLVRDIKELYEEIHGAPG